MEDCQFPMPKIVSSVKMKSQDNATDFFDFNGTVHYEFLPNGQTVNQAYCLEVLKSLRENVRRKRPEPFVNNSWMSLLTRYSVREYLAEKQITVLEHREDVVY